MSRSKFFAAFLCLVLAGCNLPSPQERKALPAGEQAGVSYDSATFFFSMIEGTFVGTTPYPDILLPQSKTLNWKACLRDNRTRLDVIGHRFVIKGGKEEMKVTTDGSSCLLWTEKLDFNYLADEKYVLLSRQIIAEGTQKGSAVVSMVVNPWRDTAFVPTTESEKQKAESLVSPLDSTTALMGAPDQPKRTFLIESPRPNIIQGEINNDHGVYRMDLSTYTNFERMKAEGYTKEKLVFNPKLKNDGSRSRKIIADIQLICFYQKAGEEPQTAVIGQLNGIEGKIQAEGMLNFSGSFKVYNYCATTATLLIGISARMEPALPLMANFEGVFVFGPAQYTVGMSFAVPDSVFLARQTEKKSYSVDEFLADTRVRYLNGATPSRERMKALPTEKAELLQKASMLKETPEFLQPFQLEFDSFALEPFQYQTSGYAKNIEREFRAKACLRFGIDQNSLRNVSLNLTKMNGQTVTVATQNNGCFEWMDSVKFNYLGNECRLVSQKVKIHSKAYNMSREVEVMMNPWLQGNSAAPVVLWFSGQDRQRPKEQECKNEKSQIFLGYYYQDYYLDRFQFRMDPYLGLQHMRWANLSLGPKLKRPSFSDPRGFEERNLPPGKYLLRYAVVDQFVKDYNNAAELKGHIYTANRAVVSVRPDGMINDMAELTTPPDAISSLAGLNQLILELVPLKEEAQHLSIIRPDSLESFVDHDTAIEVTPFGGQLIFQSESGGFRMIPEWIGKSLVNHLEKHFLRERRQLEAGVEKVSKKENMAKFTELELYNLNSKEEVKKLQNYMGAYGGGSFFGQGNLTIQRVREWLDGSPLRSNEASILCGYMFNYLWAKPFKDRTYGAYPTYSDSTRVQVSSYLAKLCASRATSKISKALQVEYKYFVKNPEFIPEKSCVKNPDTGKDDCTSRVNPKFTKTSMSVGLGFFMAKDYGFGTSWGGDVKTKASLPGSGMGFEFAVGAGQFDVKGNAIGYSRGMNFDIDALRFKVKARDAERCLAIRLNPAMVYKKDSLFILWEVDSTFRKYMKQDLTADEMSEIFSRGILICDGKPLGRPVYFEEDYFFVRGANGKGLVGDTLSSSHVKDWFASLRGMGDFLTFRSFVQNSYDRPPTVEPEVTEQQEDFNPVQANFARGSRSMPGVFSTSKPIPLK